MQDKVQKQFTITLDVETVDTQRQVPSECYKKSGALVAINTPLTILCRHIPHQQTIEEPQQQGFAYLQSANIHNQISKRMPILP